MRPPSADLSVCRIVVQGTPLPAWIASFRLCERTGSELGLDWAVRRLKTSLGETASDQGEDVDAVELPMNIQRCRWLRGR